MNPTYHHFATHDDSEYPHLWRGVVGAWAPCLGPSGTRLHDHSGRANWGTLTNMNAAEDWVVDGGRYAIVFAGGSTEAVLVSDSTPGVPDLTSAGSRYWTLAAWVEPTASNIANAVAITFGRWAASLGMQSSTRLVEHWRNNSTVYRSTLSIPLNLWSHIAVINQPDGENTDRVSIFLNGAEDAVFTGVPLISTTSNFRQGFSIGSVPYGVRTGATWPGLINDALTHYRALHRSEIRELYEIGPGGMYTPRRRRRAYSFGPSFLAAWARGSNVLLQPCGVS